MCYITVCHRSSIIAIYLISNSFTMKTIQYLSLPRRISTQSKDAQDQPERCSLPGCAGVYPADGKQLMEHKWLWMRGGIKNMAWVVRLQIWTEQSPGIDCIVMMMMRADQWTRRNCFSWKWDFIRKWNFLLNMYYWIMNTSSSSLPFHFIYRAYFRCYYYLWILLTIDCYIVVADPNVYTPAWFMLWKGSSHFRFALNTQRLRGSSRPRLIQSESEYWLHQEDAD